MIKVAPSLACADSFHFQRDLERMIEAKPDQFHFDVMDGQFVPNFCLNFDLLKRIKRVTDIPVDVHMMVLDGDKYINQLIDAGADYIALHIEAISHPVRAMRLIRASGAKAGIALNPATDCAFLKYLIDDIDLVVVMSVDPGFAGQTIIPAVLPKIREIRTLIDQSGSAIDLLVDGNVSEENGRKMVSAGANALVLGSSSLFGADKRGSYAQTMDTFRNMG